MRILVAGSGVAGLTAALHAHEAGHAVTLVSKGALEGGSTVLAQGGVAGVYGPGDSAQQHASDTLSASGGLADPVAVDVLVREGAARIAELITRGVAFDRARDGMLLRGHEAAHSHARIVHAGGDATGAAISAALADAVRRSPITVVERAFLADLLVEAGVVQGAVLLTEAGRVSHLADAVILATGGAGELYAHTTNPADSTGDGIAAALRAGAEVADLEFVQFHPTVLASGAPFLISEAVRGEGAVLVDDDDRRFMTDVHPNAELASRDVVARAIARQAAEQGAPVRLDATALGRQRLAERFPTIDRITRQRGFDWARHPIPVTPAAHYLMGGIVTDLYGRTTLPGLFAVGEVARTGVHGANRLASNSLLEAAVFAARAADSLRHAPAPSPRSQRMPLSDAHSGHFCDPDGSRDADGCADRDRVGNEPFSRTALQSLMWDHVGLLRTDDGLDAAVRRLESWHAPAPTTVAEHEDANLLLVARATASAASLRTESIGAHHRTPSPALIGV